MFAFDPSTMLLYETMQSKHYITFLFSCRRTDDVKTGVCQMQTGTPASLNSALVSLNKVPVSPNSTSVNLNSTLISLFTVSSQ